MNVNGSGLATSDGRWRRRRDGLLTIGEAVPVLLRTSTPVVAVKHRGDKTTIVVRTSDLLVAAARAPSRVTPVRVVRVRDAPRRLPAQVRAQGEWW